LVLVGFLIDSLLIFTAFNLRLSLIDVGILQPLKPN